MLECFLLLYVFFKIGILGFGGGYTMLSMIMTEAQQFGISMEQMADLNALDMIIPGPIAINSATYVGYLAHGFWGALFATIGVCLPSLIIVSLFMWMLTRYREVPIINDFLTGVKPAAVGLIAAAAAMIASAVLVNEGAKFSEILSNPLGTLSFLAIAVFLITAVANIRFKINPILLTALAGLVGGGIHFFFYT